MLNSIEGIYRKGKVELAEVPSNIDDDTRVIVTFLKSRSIDLRKRGIDEAQAADCPPLQRIGIAPKWTFMMTMMQQDPTYRRGDVVLVLFPHSNLRTARPRPALVIQADELQTRLPQLVVAMITSRMFRSDHPSRITVLLSSPEGLQSGLLSDSVVMTDNCYYCSF